MPGRTILANPGDFLCCPNGHRVFRAKAVILDGVVRSEDFEPARDDVALPLPGEAIPPCPQCGLFLALGGYVLPNFERAA